MGRHYLVILIVFALLGFAGTADTYRSFMQNLILCSPMNRNTGKLMDDISKISQPTIQNDAYYKECAYYFDGNGDGVLFPYHRYYDITNQFTFMFWAKPENLTGTYQGIFGRQNTAANNSVWAVTWELTNNSYSLYTSAQTGTSPYGSSHIAITDNNWHHIAYTYNGATFKKFLDGRLVQSYALTFSLASSNKNVTLGILDSGNTAATSFFGKLRHTGLWTMPLPESVITQHYILTNPICQ